MIFELDVTRRMRVNTIDSLLVIMILVIRGIDNFATTKQVLILINYTSSSTKSDKYRL